eukprot:1140006-Pelagomonas_calceolata.AAC.10
MIQSSEQPACLCRGGGIVDAAGLAMKGCGVEVHNKFRSLQQLLNNCSQHVSCLNHRQRATSLVTISLFARTCGGQGRGTKGWLLPCKSNTKSADYCSGTREAVMQQYLRGTDRNSLVSLQGRGPALLSVVVVFDLLPLRVLPPFFFALFAYWVVGLHPRWVAAFGLYQASKHCPSYFHLGLLYLVYLLLAMVEVEAPGTEKEANKGEGSEVKNVVGRCFCAGPASSPT